MSAAEAQACTLEAKIGHSEASNAENRLWMSESTSESGANQEERGARARDGGEEHPHCGMWSSAVAKRYSSSLRAARLALARTSEVGKAPDMS